VYQDGKIAFANPAGIRLLGAQHDTDLIGRSLTQLLHPDAIEFLSSTGEQLLQGHVERLSFEGQIIRLDGSLMEAEITISRLHYHHKPALQVIVSDISERSRHLKAIEAQNRILKDIAWDQSHLVRAPLARMMGLLGLMEDDNFEDFPQAEMIRFIMNSAHELDQIIRNISDKAYAVSLIQDEYQQYKPADFRHHAISNIEVLLIDDDPVIQKLQRTVLIRNGLHDAPRSFLTALEALEFILSHDKPGTVFLLMLDINMPRMNGWELLEALRQHKLSSHLMVIMLTSSIDISDRIRASEYPEVIEYLTKPINRHTAQELQNHPLLSYLWKKNNHQGNSSG
jgi:PAS domain S-box-containing protein